MKACVIYAQRTGRRGELMWYDGSKFTNNRAPRYYGTSDRAKAIARSLESRISVLADYRGLDSPPNLAVPRARRKNPSWPSEESQLQEAAARLEDFSGHAARRTLRIRSHSNRRTGFVAGELFRIG